jgi:hypothetical protein
MPIKANANVVERRTELRHDAEGEIKFWPEALAFRTIPGRLADLSGEGFRARHGCQELGPGQFVRFQHAGAEGRARVVWTRIVGERVESGFRIVGPAPTRTA